MKVSVLGAGAIGSMFGGLIKHHCPSTEVMLITRGEHLRAIEQQGGVRLLGPWGDMTATVKASENPEQIAGSDFVLLTVKSYSTEAAVTSAMPYLNDAIMISIQNGINQRALGSLVPAQRLVMGMTATNIAIVEPGTVELRRNGMSVLGPVSRETPEAAVQSATELLSRTGLPFSAHPNILGCQYNKLIFSTLGAASSISDSILIPHGIIDRRYRNQVVMPLQAEALRVLQQAKVDVASITDPANVWKFRRLLRTMNLPLVGWVVQRVVWMMFRNKPIRFSFGEDLRRGRPTEVEALNGEIVRLANQAGTTAPLNAKVMEMVDQCAREGRRFSQDEVCKIFEQLT